MLYWLIMLGLLVHNSSALHFGVEEENHLWRRGGPSARAVDKECRKDILVIWDNSQSIGLGSFKDKVVPFLENLIKSPKLNVGEQGTQFGFITFSSKERTKTLLNIGEKKTAKELEAWLNSLDYKLNLMGPRTYTGKAFKIANETFYKPSPLNHRPDIADVILLFTDGEPRAKTRKLTAEQTLLAQQCSASLKDDKGVKIIGLAVGLPQVVGKFLPLIKEWSSEDSVFSTKLDELDNVLDQLVAKTCENPGECLCTKPIVPFTVYAGPGQQSARVSWPEPGAETEKGNACERGSVDPPGSASGKRYSLGRHVVTYRFSNGAEDPKFANCLVEFTVVPCKCPPTQTAKEKVREGKTTVEVTWKKPEPDCPTKPSPDNPRKTSAYFSVGNYTRTYEYTYNQPGSESFKLRCHVNIVITGEVCGKSTYDPANEDCCCGEVYEKKSTHDCCGNAFYDTRTHTCCSKTRAVVRSNAENCP